MHITLNLAPAESARDRYALAWGMPVALAGAAVLVLAGRGALHEFREYRDVARQVAEARQHVGDLRAQEEAVRRNFAEPANGELLRRANFVNLLIDQRRLSVAELCARLAELLPRDARLTGLALSASGEAANGYSIKLGIAAKSEEAVESFLNDLEDAADFREVAIINEGFLEESSQAGQVNITCTARYIPGSGIQTPAVRGQERRGGG